MTIFMRPKKKHSVAIPSICFRGPWLHTYTRSMLFKTYSGGIEYMVEKAGCFEGEISMLSRGLYGKVVNIKYSIHRKVASRSTSRLVAHPRIFRLFMEGKKGPKFISGSVYCSPLALYTSFLSI